MAKRIADKELTDRNWDQEDEGEEAGTFSVATEDVMKNRAIKKARRRNIAAEGEPGGAFKGFKGFAVGSSSTFSTFGNGGGFKGLSTLTNGGGGLAPSFSATSSLSTAASAPGPAAFNGSANSGKEYSRQLTALNRSVRDWISKHVDDNPLCDLQPIFRDYERHLATIERRYGTAATGTDDQKASLPASSTSTALSLEDKADNPPAIVTFNFGHKVDSSVAKSAAPAPAFPLFGSASQSLAETDHSAPSEETAGDDTYEPPKPEVRDVKEDDAFYSKRCKLFYKKDEEFKEKGVGTLHLKRTAEGKTQMIVRADTNLGNILLNILLSADVRCSRMGNNNVMLLCVPNPPIHLQQPAGPVPLLVRVKTADDADQLHRTLEENKG